MALHMNRVRIFKSIRATTTCAIFIASASTSTTSFVSGFSRPNFLKSKSHCTGSSTTSRMSSSTSNTAKYATFEVAQFQCLDDNYGYLIHDTVTGDTAAVDTPDASTYQAELDKRGWKLSHILK